MRHISWDELESQAPGISVEFDRDINSEQQALIVGIRRSVDNSVNFVAEGVDCSTSDPGDHLRYDEEGVCDCWTYRDARSAARVGVSSGWHKRKCVCCWSWLCRYSVR